MANTHRILDGITTLHSQYDILVMGGKNVGKTALIYKFLERIPPPIHESADELHAKMIDVLLDTPQATSASSVSSGYEEITILDACSSADSYASSKSQQVRNAHTVLFVYNLGNRDSFEALEYMIDGVLIMRSDLPPPFVVVALELEDVTEYQVLDYEGAELAGRFGAPFFEVSIRNTEEVKSPFQFLVHKALEIRGLGMQSMDEQLLQAHASEPSPAAESVSPRISGEENLPSASSHETSSTDAPITPILIGSAPLLEEHSAEEKIFSPASPGSQPSSPRSITTMDKRRTTRSDAVSKPKSGCCVIV